MPNPSGWASFYKERIQSESYSDYCAVRYRPFLVQIHDRIRGDDHVAEIGCGLGTMTKLLRNMSDTFGLCAFDIDADMAEIARLSLENVTVGLGDAKQPTECKPDIVYSHGMLEHFSDDDIRATIDAHRKDGARHAVHYVPGDKYKTPSFGDERLMTVDDWKRICSPTSVVEFNDGYDYALTWDFK